MCRLHSCSSATCANYADKKAVLTTFTLGIGAAEELKHITAQHSVGLLKIILLQSIPDNTCLAALNAIYFPYKLLKGPSSNPVWAATESPKITKLHSETKQNNHEPSSKKMFCKFKNCAAS